MLNRMILATALALTLGMTAFAEDAPSNVAVTVKGIMQEDKAGFFIFADGQYFDLVFAEDSSADMKKFHSSLEGDMVQVKGHLVIEKNKEGKFHFVVLANDATRLRGVRAAVVQIEPRVIEEHTVYVERERSRGIHFPGVHITW